MNALPEEIINVEDFRSAQVVGRMFNWTSKSSARTTVHGGGDPSVVKIQKSARELDPEFNTLPCEVIEFLEDGLVIEAPSRSCAAGHELKLGLEIRNAKDTPFFRCSVKVLEVQQLDGDRQTVVTKFTQHDPAEWEKFVGYFSDRQEKLMELFHSVRGF